MTAWVASAVAETIGTAATTAKTDGTETLWIRALPERLASSGMRATAFAAASAKSPDSSSVVPTSLGTSPMTRNAGNSEAKTIKTAGMTAPGFRSNSIASLRASAPTPMPRQPSVHRLRSDEIEIDVLERAFVGRHAHDARAFADTSRATIAGISDGDRRWRIRGARRRPRSSMMTRAPVPALRSVAGVSKASRSVLRMAIRSASSSASPRLCVETRIARPSDRSSENQIANVPCAGRIEPGGRLIEQQHRRLVNQRARDRDTLLEALRKLAGDLARRDRATSTCCSAASTARPDRRGRAAAHR